MDQQNKPKPVLTPEEIARLEAEAAASIQRGEAPRTPETLTPASAEAQSESGARPAGDARPDFVPYVDDVPPAPKPDANAPEAEDDEEYIPSKWEVKVNALSDRQWKRVQIIGGVVLALATLAILFFGSEELSTYRMVVAALLALLLPRYIERVIRKELTLARRTMIVALLLGLAILFLVIGAQHGFQFTKAE